MTSSNNKTENYTITSNVEFRSANCNAALNGTIDSYIDTKTLLDVSAIQIFKKAYNYSNGTIEDELLKKDHVFDRTDVRVIFTIIYTLVFCFCFFGEFYI